jgi:hypothetical protein
VIGTSADGLAAALILLLAGGASLAMFGIAVSRGASTN